MLSFLHTNHCELKNQIDIIILKILLQLHDSLGCCSLIYARIYHYEMCTRCMHTMDIESTCGVYPSVGLTMVLCHAFIIACIIDPYNMYILLHATATEHGTARGE